MSRNISFFLTTPQFKAGIKDVTRRMGWLNLKADEKLCAIKKGQGLKRGERIERLGMIEVRGARREPLRWMIDERDYGIEECRREGFPDMTPEEFVAFFCKGHKDCTPDSFVTRIEFVKLPATAAGDNGHG